MTEFLTCEAGGELSLQKARRLTEEEKKDYVPICVFVPDNQQVCSDVLLIVHHCGFASTLH